MAVDQLGVWKDLGQLELADDWQFFPEFPDKYYSTFRVFFIGNITLLQNLRITCFIRGAYFSGSQYYFDEFWKRLYPKEEPEIFRYPYPRDIIQDNLPKRQMMAKRKLRFRSPATLEATPPFTIQLQELQSSEAVYPTEVEESILKDEQST